MCCAEGDGRNLAAVAPLAEEGEDEALDDDGADAEREQVARALAVAACLLLAEAAAELAARTRALLELVERNRAVVLRDLLLGLAHLLLDLGVPAVHGAALGEHARAEDGEERGRRRLRPRARDEGGEDVAEPGGQDGHDEECAERACEHGQARVPHREDGGEQERLVPDLGHNDHRERVEHRPRRGLFVGRGHAANGLGWPAAVVVVEVNVVAGTGVASLPFASISDSVDVGDDMRDVCSLVSADFDPPGAYTACFS
jgi:hypothetical protein